MATDNTKVRAFISHFPDSISFVTSKGDAFHFTDHYLKTSDPEILKSIDEAINHRFSPMEIEEVDPAKVTAAPTQTKVDTRRAADAGSGTTISVADLQARLAAAKQAEAEKSAQLEAAAPAADPIKAMTKGIASTANSGGNAVESNSGASK